MREEINSRKADLVDKFGYTLMSALSFRAFDEFIIEK